MSFFERLLLVFGLAMDGFAASVCLGLSPENSGLRRALAAGAVTGLHGVFFALGHGVGLFGARWLGPLCRWLPGLLLLALGGLSFRPKKDGEEEKGGLGLGRILAYAASSSIDAATVGLSFALRGESLGPALGLVFLVMGTLSLLGLYLGRLLGRGARARAERIGGLILCLLGLKNLLKG